MPGLLDDPRLDWAFLKKYGFDVKRFEHRASAIAKGELTEATALIFKDRLGPVPKDTVIDCAAPKSAKAGPFDTRGREALSKGQVACVVLNGGMATRFGGVVKGVVEVYDKKSFLALKAEDVRRASKTFGAPIPMILMNSFATNDATHAHLVEHDRFGLDAKNLLDFSQSVSIRMSPEGSLFIGKDGKPSYHAPGHGDFFECIRGSGVLREMIRRGVRVLLFSNVDNLGATIDPMIIGHHLESGAAMTAEVTEKRRTASGQWDKGGAPCLVDSKLQLVEGFRFPKDFPQEQLPDFSTNNMLFQAEAIDKEILLERHVVRKAVDDKPALQLESITCEASGLRDQSDRPTLPLSLLRVPREGPTGRFFPVKEPIDLDTLRPVLKQRLEDGWQLRDH